MKLSINFTKKFAVIGAVLVLCGLSSRAQQIPMFNNNIVNPFSMNPSQAGVGESQILFQHRQQWIGIQGAPESTLLTSEWRLGKSKTAVGFSLSRDRANVIANTSSYATVARHFTLKEKHQLSFGASAGVRHNSIDFARVDAHDAGDNLLFDDRQSSTNFDARFGLSYRFKGLEVQGAALQLFGNRATYNNSFDQNHLEYQFVRHFFVSAAYRFEVAKTVGMTPMIQLRGMQGFAFQPEGIVRFDFKKNLWLAGHYRHGRSVAVTGGVAIQDKYVFGYSGEVATTSLAGYNGGTHEIIFGIKLGSAFKNHGQKREIDGLKKSVKTYDERLQYLQEANRKLEAEIASQRKKMESVKQQNPEMDYAEVRRLIEAETDKKIKEYEANRPKIDASAVDVPSPEFENNTGGSEDGVRGIDQPYYVIIATVKTLNRAKRTAKRARKNYNLESFVIHPFGGQFYFVTTSGFDDRPAAVEELKRVFKAGTTREFNGKPWILEEQELPAGR